MKRIVLILTILFTLSVGASKAQTIVATKDTVKNLLQNYLIEQYSYIKNTHNDSIKISWRIYSHNLPQDWIDNAQFGLCDNVTCYSKAILGGSTQITANIPVGDSTLFKGQLNGANAGVTSKGTFYYAAEAWNATTRDTVVFIVSEWPASVSKISELKNNEVVMYPNPAKDELNVLYDKNAGIKNIAIYNLVGKQVSIFRVGGSSAKLDISNIPSGVYFIRLIDAGGQVTATRRFTHQ